LIGKHQGIPLPESNFSKPKDDETQTLSLNESNQQTPSRQSVLDLRAAVPQRGLSYSRTGSVSR